MGQFWKENWDRTRERLEAWWQGEGMALCLFAPKDEPWEEIEPPPEPDTVEEWWLDPVYRARKDEYRLAHTYFGAESFPYFDTQIGPGNLATLLGTPADHTSKSTVWWKEPNIDDPDSFPPLTLKADPVQQQMALIDEGLRISEGRFIVGMPDLVENLDILLAMRGTQPVLFDLIERPAWVKAKLAEINEAFYEIFDAIYAKIEAWGGNAFAAFKIWGPGKTAKVQCDASAMISPDMFAEFVVPPLAEQCEWLDYSMYHLDGSQAIVQLDHLLSIDALDAIEWTPDPRVPRGGDPVWYDMYRKIKAAGKGVQAIGVRVDQVIPLIEAVGPEGLFMIVNAESETEARELEEKVEAYR